MEETGGRGLNRLDGDVKETRVTESLLRTMRLAGESRFGAAGGDQNMTHSLMLNRQMPSEKIPSTLLAFPALIPGIWPRRSLAQEFRRRRISQSLQDSRNTTVAYLSAHRRFWINVT